MGEISFPAIACSPHLGSPNKGLTPFASTGSGTPNAWHQLFDSTLDAAIVAFYPKLPSNFTTTNLALEVIYVKNNTSVQIVTFQLDLTFNGPTSPAYTITIISADEGDEDDATTSATAYKPEMHSVSPSDNLHDATAGNEVAITLWMLGATGTNHSLTSDLQVRGITLVWDDA